MAVEQFFNNQSVIEPGVYSQTKSGIKNKPVAASYGKVLLIDTGMGINFIGGAGFKGRFAEGADSVYEFSTLQEFQAHVQGGDYHLLGEALFFPLGRQNRAVKGAPSVSIVRAATTTAATLVLSGTNLTINLTAKNEGTVSNGVVASGVLTKGLGAKVVRSTEQPGAFELEVYTTSYKGVDWNGKVVDKVIESATNVLVLRSAPFTTGGEFNKWSQSNRTFNQLFSGFAGGAGTITDAVLSTTGTLTPFAGGTTVYNKALVGEILDALTELDYTFVMTDLHDNQATSAENLLVLGHLVQETKFKKYMVVQGSCYSGGFEDSVAAAKVLNSSRAILVHGGLKATNKRTGMLDEATPLLKAAKVLGRLAGLNPYDPLTYKAIAMEAEAETLTEAQRRRAIKAGVLHTRFDDGDFVVNIGINTLQDNKNLVTDQGESPYIQVEMIDAQLRKDLSLQTKRRFLKKIADGPNRFTMSEVELENFTKEYLQSVCVKDGQNNLILSYQDVVATVTADSIYVTFGYVPNFEVNKVFFTSIMLDPNANL
jgi:hypothetical protein